MIEPLWYRFEVAQPAEHPGEGVAEPVDGPQAALNLVDSLAAREKLSGYHLYPAVRADLLARLNRRDEAREAYREAIALARLAPERRWLERRLAELERA